MTSPIRRTRRERTGQAAVPHRPGAYRPLFLPRLRTLPLLQQRHGPEQRRSDGIPGPSSITVPLVGAILQSGYHWEREVVEILAGRVVVAARQRRLPAPPSAGADARCCRPRAGRPLSLSAHADAAAALLRTYGLDPRLVVISDNHPDLIEILPDADGSRLLRVVDVKRGETLKLTHRVQILLYALELQALLDAEGIAARR